MRRKKIFLAMSLLIASTGLAQAANHSNTLNSDGSSLSAEQNRGIWSRLYWNHKNAAAAEETVVEEVTEEVADVTDTVTTETTLTATAVTDMEAETPDATVTDTVITGTELETPEATDTPLTDAEIVIPEEVEAVATDDPVPTDTVLADPAVTQVAGAVSTLGVKCDYSEDAYNEAVADNSTSQWSCNETESKRELTANGLPDHDIGTFPNEGNPNTITPQAIFNSIPLNPIKTETITKPDVIGYALNGVQIDPVTTGSCNLAADDCSVTDNSGIWSIEAQGQTSFNFGSDDNNGYVKADGSYRYHGMPEGFLQSQGASDAVMTLIGWAADGFPIYGRHGHSDAEDADSALKVVTGSYQQVEVADVNRPPVDTYALGTFTQDWEYVEGSGDLDECNGRMGVTPEFPNGIYHYFATDFYPYLPRCVKGKIESVGVVADTVINTTENAAVTEVQDQVDNLIENPNLETLSIEQQISNIYAALEALSRQLGIEVIER